MVTETVLVQEALKYGQELERLKSRMDEVTSARREVFLSLLSCGWTQRQIAEAVGLSQPRVAQIVGIQKPHK